MDGLETAQEILQANSAEQLVNDVLVWIGFGTVVGLLAKGIMPGRDPGGAMVTVLLGIGGTILGCAVASCFRGGQRVVPISPVGMLVGVVGALFVLLLYKWVSSYYFVDGEYIPSSRRRGGPFGREQRRLDTAVYED